MILLNHLIVQKEGVLAASRVAHFIQSLKNGKLVQ